MSQQFFSITKSAEEKISELLVSEVQDAKLRVRVLGGGCSGFKYEYTFDNKLSADDRIYGDSGKVVIDELSLRLVENGMLDYQEDLGHSGFVVKNPQASARCGCGNSFAV